VRSMVVTTSDASSQMLIDGAIGTTSATGRR
jgi:hypothetical protein